MAIEAKVARGDIVGYQCMALPWNPAQGISQVFMSGVAGVNVRNAQGNIVGNFRGTHAVNVTKERLLIFLPSVWDGNRAGELRCIPSAALSTIAEDGGGATNPLWGVESCIWRHQAHERFRDHRQIVLDVELAVREVRAVMIRVSFRAVAFGPRLDLEPTDRCTGLPPG